MLRLLVAALCVCYIEATTALTYGTILAMRIGNGSFPVSYTGMQQTVLEEWSLPTSAGGSASLVSTVTYPGACNALSTGSTTTQGFLTRANDASTILFVCYNTSIGAVKDSNSEW